MHPISSTESILAWVSMAVFSLCGVLYFLSKNKPSQPSEGVKSPYHQLMNSILSQGIWGAALIKLTLIIITLRLGYETMWPDDACRYLMSFGFKEQLSLGPGDHIWPGGPFIMTGFLMRYFDNPVTAVYLLSCFFSVGSVISGGKLIEYTTGSKLAGGLTALMIALVPMHTWLSTGTMTSVPVTFFYFTSLICWVVGWDKIEKQAPFGYTLTMLGGLFTTIATSFRYEAWFFCLSVGTVFGIALLINRIKVFMTIKSKQGKVTFFQLLDKKTIVLIISLLLCGLYPILWICSGWYHHGDPLYVIHASAGMNHEWMDHPFWQRIMVYPTHSSYHLRPLSGLVAAGILCSLGLAIQFRRIKLLSVAMASYLILCILLVVLNGTGVSMDRYSMITGVFSLPFAGVAVFLALLCYQKVNKWWKIVPITALLTAFITTMFYFYDSFNTAGQYKWWGYRNESFIAGYILSQEFHEPQLLPGLRKGGEVLIWYPGPIDENQSYNPGTAIISMMSTGGERVHLYENETFPEHWANKENAVVIQIGNLASKTPPDSYTSVGEIGYLKLFHDKQALNATTQ